ncbi:hypothetical protein [Christiangramia sp.]|uniref:hypothetical protein n=1 Tax=Christiangramia sp. TaxID=1931228 RepID=UPI0026390DBB|nr:hypothetical protein [Christiangramia sp.]
MKTLNQLPVPQDTDSSKWPFGNIKNETETEPGTPVVREIYGDVLVNMYKILQDSGISPSGQEDSEQAGYQILQAFKNFVNDLNDIEKVTTLTGTQWIINMDITNLPDKYVVFARMSEAYDKNQTYTFKGSTGTEYSFKSPTGFNASDEALIVIDQAEVRAYSFSAVTTAVTSGGVFPVFGNPLAFNNTDTLYYESEGSILTDTPSIKNLQQSIRLLTSVSTLYVNEILVLKSHVFCVAFDTAAVKYRFFQFALADLDTAEEITVTGVTMTEGTDNSPYIFTDGVYIYMTNSSNRSANDFELDKFAYDPATDSLTFSQSVSLEPGYFKTTNTVISNGNLITFADGSLVRYALSNGASTSLGQYNAVAGIIFNYNGQVFYTNGEVAKNWNV